MYEIRWTADSCQSESGGKAWGGSKASLPQGRITWVETECPEAQAGEPRIPVQVRTELGRSQSPHSSDEAGNDRGAKEDRKVEA